MKQNSLIEIGSKATNVIISFNTPTTINGKNYKKNEPFLLLKEVTTIIEYAAAGDVEGLGSKKAIASSFINPTKIYITGTNFTRKICSLLSTFVGESQVFLSNEMKTLSAQKGDENPVIYLTDPISEAKEFYVYDDEFERVEGVIYDSINHTLTSPEFVEGNSYLLSFATERIGTRFNLKKPVIPYMNIEIQGTGNIDKKTSNIYAFFGKVALVNSMEFNFVQNDMIKAPLEFEIITDGENYIVFEDRNG